MTSYSDEEVKEAIKGNEYPPAWNDRQMEVLQWAASQYLKAKMVVEWYGDKENYKRTWDENNDPKWINVIEDYGQRAREFLEESNGRK